MVGRVKWWNYKEKYGFIETDNDKNIFVYLDSSENKELKEGETIEFELKTIGTSLFLKYNKSLIVQKV